MWCHTYKAFTNSSIIWGLISLSNSTQWILKRFVLVFLLNCFCSGMPSKWLTTLLIPSYNNYLFIFSIIYIFLFCSVSFDWEIYDWRPKCSEECNYCGVRLRHVECSPDHNNLCRGMSINQIFLSTIYHTLVCG